LSTGAPGAVAVAREPGADPLTPDPHPLSVIAMTNPTMRHQPPESRRRARPPVVASYLTLLSFPRSPSRQTCGAQIVCQDGAP
jgi:hypothetical protein